MYVDGEKQKGEEQVFETSDIGDDILKADLEDNVYICTDAINLYEAMKETAQLYQDVGGNLEAYADKLDERMQEEAEAAREDEDSSEWDLHF